TPTPPAGTTGKFNMPIGLTVDAAGNVYVADSGNNTIRKITSAGVVTTFAGSALANVNLIGGSLDGTGATATFITPTGITMDSTGNLFVANMDDGNIRKVTSAAVATIFAGLVPVPGSANVGMNKDGTGTLAEFVFPHAIAIDSTNNLYVADAFNNNIRKITPAGVVTTFAGCTTAVGCAAGSTDGSTATAKFNTPQGIAVDSAGNVYVSDTGNHIIRKISGGVVSTLAGTAGMPDITDGQGAAARFDTPQGIALDSLGNLYVADEMNSTIRKITSTGLVSTYAGLPNIQNVSNLYYANGSLTAARFDLPGGIAVDAANNLYIADTGNNVIRKITAAGVVSTLAGTPTVSGYTDTP
ncbi:MAG: hypothetical protein HOP24_00915, partial [Sideroxydans sp.]|nr:hypothetical protein [Sideroxydans sp.]